MLLRFFSPHASLSDGFLRELHARKLALGHADPLIPIVAAFSVSAPVHGHFSLDFTASSFDAAEPPDAAAELSSAAARGYVVTVNSRAALDSGARLEAAIAASLASNAHGPCFVFAAFCDLKTLTTTYRLSLPALVLRDDNGLIADVASARTCDATAPGSSSTEGEARLPELALCDALPATAAPPPAPLGWPARAELAACAVRTRATAVRATLTRPPASAIAVVLTLSPPSEAACAALLAPDAAWRGVLHDALAGGFARVAAGPAVLPTGFASVGRGEVTHASPLHAAGREGESDAASLASTAMRLNLQLMAWRALPEVDIPRLEATRVLLIGAGALGAAVARPLLAWGIHRLTFVDGARVALSNAPRQNLFVAADAAAGSHKALAAAAAIRAAHPGSEAAGIVLDVPTPGRAADTPPVALVNAIDALRGAMAAADAILLLVDSREARWLPTLLAAASGDKLVISVGIGFDDALVVRHGVGENGLGCFFCAGADGQTAPRNSRRSAGMDALCTVSRPGTAAIAGALAAELLVAIIHHPAHSGAPHEPAAGSAAAAAAAERPLSPHASPSPLGACAHVTRVSLRGPPSIVTAAAPRARDCVACGDGVRRALAARGDAFLLEALVDERAIAVAASGGVDDDAGADDAAPDVDGGAEWQAI